MKDALSLSQSSFTHDSTLTRSLSSLIFDNVVIHRGVLGGVGDSN